MKRTIGCGLGLALLATTAQAQGTVTLFGGADANITRVSAQGKGHVWQMRDGGMYVTKIGFTGREDLGGGYSTHFYLESQASSDTGNGVASNASNLFTGASGSGLAFNRKATVSLFTPAGELRFGRDYTPTFAAPAYFDPFFSAGVASAVNYQPYYKYNRHTGSTVAPGTNVRASNSIAYHSPASLLKGLDLYYQQAFDENVGPKYRAVGVSYLSGPLLVAAGYSRSKGVFRDGAAVGLTPETASLDNELTVWSAGAWYAFGRFKLMGFYHSQKIDAYGETVRAPAVALTERGRKVDDWMAGFSWALGLHTLKFAMMQRDDQGLENADSRQLGLGWSYHLSKRTAVYANLVDIRNKNTAAYNFIASGLLPVTGGKASAVQTGLSHQF